MQAIARFGQKEPNLQVPP